MATQRSTHTAGRSTTAGMIGLAVLLAAAMIGSLLIALSRSTAIQAPAPAAPVAAPAVAAPPANAGHANRLFADEVAGAGAQYRDAASLAGPLPERLQDLARPAAPAVAAPQMRPGVTSRFFADEIAAGAGVADAMTFEHPGALPQGGPR